MTPSAAPRANAVGVAGRDGVEDAAAGEARAVVGHVEDPQVPRRLRRQRDRFEFDARRGPAQRQPQHETRPEARRTVQRNGAAVPLHRAVHHRQAQAGAPLAFGGEERFQASLPGLLAHARAGVFDL